MSMYYHTTMRIVAITFAALILIGMAQPAFSREAPLAPRFTLTDSVEEDWGITELADWYSQRIFEGIGWRLGTVSRGGGSVMKGGYTVIHPTKGEPFSWQHIYVLAAFDLLPDVILLVAVRDPELFIADWDYSETITDAVELVWLDDTWEEQYAARLDFADMSFPDSLVLAPDQRSILAILHPTDGDDELVQAGHKLVSISMLDGEISDIPLPGTEGLDGPPAAWWPVLLQWDGDALLAQMGSELRRYEVHWE